MSDHGRGAPSTKGYEISRFEVRAFVAALGLDPKQVDSITIKDKRVIANLLDGESIAIPIRESRGEA
jgi:hypothetical protein